MRRFLAYLRLSGGPWTRPELEPVLRLLEQESSGGVDIEVDGPFVAAASSAGTTRAVIGSNSSVAVGDVRLDHPEDVIPPRVAADHPGNHLAVALTSCMSSLRVRELLGDFAFVSWDRTTQQLLAARDAFGVKSLYYRATPGVLKLASHPHLLGALDEYDEEYIAEFLAGGTAPAHKTIYRGIHALAAGESLLAANQRTTRHRYWTAREFSPRHQYDASEAIEAFQVLFEEAVLRRISDVERGALWAQLSGGLDSSSVVCTAVTLARNGRTRADVAGTVTAVETLDSGDERAFSNAVVQRYDLRNRLVIDDWPWRDDGQAPPRTPMPRPFYPFFARDRRMCDIVRREGGSVLLSGTGSDNYLYGNLKFIADLVADGRLRSATRALTQWSVATRQSFWVTAFRHGVFPLLPLWTKSALERPKERLPDWLEPLFARRLDVASRVPAVRQRRSAQGGCFAEGVFDDVERIPHWIDEGPCRDRIQMRYPFLYRPLVEFSLGLPPELRIRPFEHKWILRQAMRGILPETVRMRTGKGGIDARIIWALRHERARIAELIREPILAELGCIRPDCLRSAVEMARGGQVSNLPFLLNTLSLETWLAVRSGRWLVGKHEPSPAAPTAPAPAPVGVNPGLRGGEHHGEEDVFRS